MQNKKAFISMPMRNRQPETINIDYEYAKKMIENNGYSVVDSRLNTEILEAQAEARHVQNLSLYGLSKALELLSTCDTILLCPGWENSRGCRIERAAARAYGLKILDFSYFDSTPIDYNTLESL